jgi:hypothetical protein
VCPNTSGLHIRTARGWGWYAKRPIEEMRKRRMNEAEIVDELFAIAIAAWKALND